MRKDINRPRLRELLRKDLARQHHKGKIQKFGLLTIVYHIFGRPGVLAVFLYRLSAACCDKRPGGAMLARLLWRLSVFLTSCDISPRAVIGGGLYLPHALCVVIGPAVMGENVTVFQNVTLGRRRHEDEFDTHENLPRVGDNVIFYPGAVVVGGISIGNNARIGANTVVLKDVPDNYTVAAPSARMVPP